MSLPSAVSAPPVDPRIGVPAVLAEPRPLYWSVLREVWENRSIYAAPLAVATLFLFGFLISAVRVAQRLRVPGSDPADLRALVRPYGLAAAMIIVTSFLVGVFYCLDALHGERRDRSILFWKSLPVSDLTTVLAKASVALVVLPLIAYGLTLATQLSMVLLNSVVLLGSGLSPSALWRSLPLPQMSLLLLYGLTVHVLWYAPLYAWLLLVSAWARRAAFLWAVLPFLALAGAERAALGTSYVGSLLVYRLRGAMVEAFSVDPARTAIMGFSQLDPERFLSRPGLWLGLALAAAFLVAAVRLRRDREPI